MEKDREMKNSVMLKAINITKIPCNRRKTCEGSQYWHSNTHVIVISDADGGSSGKARKETSMSQVCLMLRKRTAGGL